MALSGSAMLAAFVWYQMQKWGVEGLPLANDSLMRADGEVQGNEALADTVHAQMQTQADEDRAESETGTGKHGQTNTDRKKYRPSQIETDAHGSTQQRQR